MALSRHDYDDWLVDALRELGGKATPVQISKWVWKHHETDLRGAGDLFYTWQYDLRWAANRLRRRGVMLPVESSPRGVWVLGREHRS